MNRVSLSKEHTSGRERCSQNVELKRKTSGDIRFINPKQTYNNEKDYNKFLSVQLFIVLVTSQ